LNLRGFYYYDTKIIIDTDPGIDDAMAILFAEAHPDIELKAMTTIFGNVTVEYATRNALSLKEKYKMKADVAQGCSQPMVRSPVGPTFN
jgi:purine nucleosidase